MGKEWILHFLHFLASLLPIPTSSYFKRFFLSLEMKVLFVFRSPEFGSLAGDKRVSKSLEIFTEQRFAEGGHISFHTTLVSVLKIKPS
jgi:hypothetical protein